MRAQNPEYLDSYTDADWAGGQVTRRSTTGTALYLGGTLLKERCKGQSCQSLSSCESECYSAVSTTAEAMHMHKLLAFIGINVKIRLRIDATAANALVERRGCGTLKHKQTRML